MFKAVQDNLPNKTQDEIDEKFVGSRGWFFNFQKRTSYKSVKISGESGSADKESADKFIMELKDLILKENYKEEQIWNVDESAYFWRMPPSKTYVANCTESQVPGTKLMKQRCSVLFGSNASGDFRLKPLLIHNVENPRALKNKKATLPVIYR